MTREVGSETASHRRPQVNLSEKRASQGSTAKSQESMQEAAGIEVGAIVLLSCFKTCTSCQWVAERACMERERRERVRRERRERGRRKIASIFGDWSFGLNEEDR